MLAIVIGVEILIKNFLKTMKEYINFLELLKNLKQNIILVLIIVIINHL